MESDLKQLVSSILTVITGVLLTLALVSVLSSSPGHDEIHQNQAHIEDQLRFIACLLLIHPEDRTPDAVAVCQVPSAP